MEMGVACLNALCLTMECRHALSRKVESCESEVEADNVSDHSLRERENEKRPEDDLKTDLYGPD
jgi:hypothetical protein